MKYKDTICVGALLPRLLRALGKLDSNEGEMVLTAALYDTRNNHLQTKIDSPRPKTWEEMDQDLPAPEVQDVLRFCEQKERE